VVVFCAQQEADPSHITEGLRLIRLAVLGSFIGSASDVLFFSQFPRKQYLDIPFAISTIFLLWAGIRVFVRAEFRFLL
jgi:hypothetical protein